MKSVGKKHSIRVRRSASPESRVKQDDVLVVLTQAFCPHGHNLIRPGEQFQGFEGLHLWVSDGAQEGLVVVSPIHGDGSKKGLSFHPGAKLEISCPDCRTPLPHLCRCSSGDGGVLRTVYLTPDLSDAHQAAVCDIWGCPRSRVIDSNEILSEFIDAELASPR
jgi:hypothetical protein